MIIKETITDILGLLCLVIICAAPLGLFKDNNGWGWYWPNVGGFYIDTTQENQQ